MRISPSTPIDEAVRHISDMHGSEAVARSLSKRDPEAVGRVAGETHAGLNAAIETSHASAPKMSGETRARIEQSREDIELAFLPANMLLSLIYRIRPFYAAGYKRDPEAAQAFRDEVA
jgi:hypothetical protein